MAPRTAPKSQSKHHTYSRSCYLEKHTRAEVDRRARELGLTVGTYIGGLVRAALNRGLPPEPSARAKQVMGAFRRAAEQG